MRETIGDWVVFYEGKKGAFGYVGVQKVKDIVPDPSRADRYFAVFEQWSEWSFETLVPRARPDGYAYETMLRNPQTGAPYHRGANTLAVRRLSDVDFARIVDFGLSVERHSDAFPREGRLPQERLGFAETQDPFERADLDTDRREILTSRPARDASFARQVKMAYQAKCAISGLELRNGFGRPEVQAAHIRPVADQGPDTVRNGIALSGTLHWMFDRGLISVGADLEILVSHNKVPEDVQGRLISPAQTLVLPDNPRQHPHPDYLRYHRENIFGQIQ